MTTSSCAQCEELRTTVPITSAATLENVLRVVRDNLGDGTIVEEAYWPAGQAKLSQPAFASISPSGPWPDYLEYYFSCANCARLYRLSAETYRGFGGSWSICEGGSRSTA
jgi:hypothetical protein